MNNEVGKDGGGAAMTHHVPARNVTCGRFSCRVIKLRVRVEVKFYKQRDYTLMISRKTTGKEPADPEHSAIGFPPTKWFRWVLAPSLSVVRNHATSYLRNAGKGERNQNHPVRRFPHRARTSSYLHPFQRRLQHLRPNREGCRG